MPKGLSGAAKDNLEKARHSAIAAVDSYNRSGSRFRTAQFIVLVVIAWTALFHAVFYKRNKKPWYLSSGKSRNKYAQIDGDPKHWDLGECLNQYFTNSNPPEKENIKFLIGLRNKIEHRHLPHLDPALYGECQATLINFESLLVAEFGKRYALADQLGIAMQFSQLIPDERGQAIKSAMRAAGQPVLDFISAYRSALPSDVLESMRYSFAVFLVPRVANRQTAADASVQFVRVDEASPEELARLQNLNVLIRDKHIPIANLNHFRPSEVVERVSKGIPHHFDLHLHTCAWKHFEVRPATNARKPEETDSRYCIFDKPHGDYLYTDAWVAHLIKNLTPATQFKTVVGKDPSPKKKGA